MQDGAAPYTAISSKYVLSDILQDRLIGKVFSIIWPPYSPNLFNLNDNPVATDKIATFEISNEYLQIFNFLCF